MAVILSGNAVLSVSISGLDNPPFPLNHARIGYQNRITSASVTASSSAAGFPASAITNPLTYDQWRPDTLPGTLTIDQGTSFDADYVGIAAHNLGTIRSPITVEYSFDSSTWVTVEDFMPADNTPIMLIFDTITARYWRITVGESSGDPAQIGVVYIGQALQMQRSIYGGHSPITLSRKDKVIPVTSEGGQWLGRSVIRQAVVTEFSWQNLTAAWYRKYFDPFVKAAVTTPFFIAWNPSKYPSEVGFCQTQQDIRPSNQGVRDYLSVSVPVLGFYDD